MDNGWIKIHRKLLEWEWYDEPNTFRLFFHLLLMANHKDKKYRGVLIKKGQVMTGLNLLSEQTGLTVRQVRTSLSRLKSTNETTIESNSKGTVIQIVKWNDYQLTTNERQTSDKPTTTNKNDNNIYNDIIVKKTLEERKTEFKNSLLKYKQDYSSDMLNNFYSYWTAKGEKDRKMKFEKQKTFDVNLRLKYWLRNEKPVKKQLKDIVNQLPDPTEAEFMVYIKNKISEDIFKRNRDMLLLRYDSLVKKNWHNFRNEKIINWQIEINDNLMYWIKK